ncbi:hypothetical protein I902_gp27 [Pelagibacter phage HTVC019P]|uniref:Uncharacterized protein n=1 Tax=Pelagibacter phage HTVC019P TaxID=1283079 RepID=M1IDA3_9CAUD|nr:hypothetical protein I902_gp27 [Pelagibacter phage HTVC019P]AGE60604.1 hypothetical protein [Pelagibacter phage HTVC019P]
MCGSRPKMPPAPEPAPTPVNTSQTVGEQTAPELVTANEQDLNIKKKKIKKSGTSALNTSSGLNIATNTTV